MRTGAFRLTAVLFCLLTLLASPSRADAPAPAKYHEALFDGAASDNSTLDVLEPANESRDKQTTLHILVTDTALQSALKTLKPAKGDVLALETVPKKDQPDMLKSVRIQTSDVSLPHAIFMLILGSALYLIACLVLTLGNPFKLVIGEDGHYSNSKFQMFIWFGILISAYLASVFSKTLHNYGTTFGSVGIPQNLLLLSGMSALTFAGAKGITTSKVQAALDKGIPDPKRATKTPNFLFDLMHNDNKQLDFGDFQMIIVTLVAVGMYIVLILHYLGAMELRAATSLPDVDTTILASFGLGQGAYLTKKAVGNAGDT